MTSEEDYFASRNGDDVNKLLREYCRTFHGPYFNIEETGVHLTEAELRASLLHCLYHGLSKHETDRPCEALVALAGDRGEAGREGRG